MIEGGQIIYEEGIGLDHIKTELHLDAIAPRTSFSYESPTCIYIEGSYIPIISITYQSNDDP